MSQDKTQCARITQSLTFLEMNQDNYCLSPSPETDEITSKRCLLLSNSTTATGLTRSWLWGVYDNLVNISTLHVEAIVQSSDSNGIGAVLKGQLDSCGKKDALVGVLLVERVDVIFIAVDDDATDAANLPCSVDAIGLSHGWKERKSVMSIRE